MSSNGKYKGQSRYYAQNAQVADKDHDEDYDMLDTVSRGSLGTRGSLNRTSLSRGSISARGNDAMVRGGSARKSALTEDFGAPEDGDYAQLNTEPVYQVLESDRATVTPATTPHHPIATPTGGYRDALVTTTTNRHSSSTVPNSNCDTYAQLNQEPVYQVLENDGSHGYRNSRRTSFTRTSLTPPSLQPDLTTPLHNPPSLPTRSRTVTDSYRIKYSDVQV